jgi:predicted SnoaL-like aldol condensation-catalyzing enzyme
VPEVRAPVLGRRLVSLPYRWPSGETLTCAVDLPLCSAGVVSDEVWTVAMRDPTASRVHAKAAATVMREDVVAMANLTLEQFKVAYQVFLEAFNRGDLATAFAALAPDCEFRTVRDIPDERPLVGREQVIAFFEDVFVVLPDWHIESVRNLQAGERTFSSHSTVGEAAVEAVEHQLSRKCRP